MGDIRAANDAHVAISNDPSFPRGGGKVYEIVLGGWGNTVVCVREEQQGGCVAQQNVPIMQGYDTSAHVTIARTGSDLTIARTGSDGATAHSLTYSSFGGISGTKYVGIMTGWGSTGSWDVCLPSDEE